MKPLIITGCQRSGTAYIAAVLSAAGHWCSHERFYSERHQRPPHPWTVESSWAAAAFLPDLDAAVVHQVRHPLAVAASVRHKFVGRTKATSIRWARRHCPQMVAKGDSGTLRALRFWVEWNRLVEPHAVLRWRVEDITVDAIADALGRSGRPADVDRISRALDLVPRDANASHADRPALTWGDLPPSRLVIQARRMADAYGYE